MNAKPQYAVLILASSCTLLASCSPTPTEPSLVQADSALAGSQSQIAGDAATSDNSSLSASTVGAEAVGNTFVSLGDCVVRPHTLLQEKCVANFRWDVPTPQGDGKATCPIVVKVRPHVLDDDPTADIKFRLTLRALNAGGQEASVKIPRVGGFGDRILRASSMEAACRFFNPDLGLLRSVEFNVEDFRKPGSARVKRVLKVKLHAHAETGNCRSAGPFSRDLEGYSVRPSWCFAFRRSSDCAEQGMQVSIDTASPISLNSVAPLTAQYFIEQHSIGDPCHHRANVRAAIATAAADR